MQRACVGRTAASHGVRAAEVVVLNGQWSFQWAQSPPQLRPNANGSATASGAAASALGPLGPRRSQPSGRGRSGRAWAVALSMQQTHALPSPASSLWDAALSMQHTYTPSPHLPPPSGDCRTRAGPISSSTEVKAEHTLPSSSTSWWRKHSSSPEVNWRVRGGARGGARG